MLVEDHIRKNKRDTVIVCTLMVLLLFSVISAFGYILFGDIYIALIFGIPIALVYVGITYSFSVRTVLSAAKARPANPQIREEKLFVYKVEEMAIAAGIPPPKTYVQESDNINAFATGKKPEKSVICATTGALRKLDKDELEGVMAHEMSHIKNHDILIATVTLAVVGTIALLAEILFYSMFWGGAGRGRKNGGGGILLIIAILLVVLAPIFSRLVYLLISRRREYLADSNGAYLTRNPEGLAKALEKIKGDHPKGKPKGSKTVAPLYIANPFKSQSVNSIWATHPPIDERIRRLRSM
ncbi:MAG: M48 family metallopeptidase [Candidatus Thermoplasmatota archaeon]|nr:M48 family metallopeptidase [Candidatus Thermoplasmatota archaeon]